MAISLEKLATIMELWREIFGHEMHFKTGIKKVKRVPHKELADRHQIKVSYWTTFTLDTRLQVSHVKKQTENRYTLKLFHLCS